MQNSKIELKDSTEKTYKKSKTIALMFITIFGVFFLSGMGLLTADFVGAGLLGGGTWFFWTVVTFLVIQSVAFSLIIYHWVRNGIRTKVIRSLYLYCWALLFVSAFVIGLQSATFGALNAQAVNIGFTAFGNIFSIIWITLMAIVIIKWIHSAATNNHLDEHRYKILRNYFFWIIAFSLFIFHFEQASSGALGVDTEKMLLNTDLGNGIISSLTGTLEAIPNIIGNWVFLHKDFVVQIMKNHDAPKWMIGALRKVDDPDKISEIVSLVLTTKFPIVFTDENAFVLSTITLLFGKGAFWGLNNSWSGWTIFVTVILGTIGITGYAYVRFKRNDVHNADNSFFVLTPLYIIIFTILMYSVNAYIVTFIDGGHLNPGIVGSHIGHLQLEVPDNASIIQIINAHWMRNILRYPVGDVFAGSYQGTWWWWTEWCVSLIGINLIIAWEFKKHGAELKEDYKTRKQILKIKKYLIADMKNSTLFKN